MLIGGYKQSEGGGLRVLSSYTIKGGYYNKKIGYSLNCNQLF